MATRKVSPSPTPLPREMCMVQCKASPKDSKIQSEQQKSKNLDTELGDTRIAHKRHSEERETNKPVNHTRRTSPVSKKRKGVFLPSFFRRKPIEESSIQTKPPSKRKNPDTKSAVAEKSPEMLESREWSSVWRSVEPKRKCDENEEKGAIENKQIGYNTSAKILPQHLLDQVSEIVRTNPGVKIDTNLTNGSGHNWEQSGSLVRSSSDPQLKDQELKELNGTNTKRKNRRKHRSKKLKEQAKSLDESSLQGNSSHTTSSVMKESQSSENILMEPTNDISDMPVSEADKSSKKSQRDAKKLAKKKKKQSQEKPEGADEKAGDKKPKAPKAPPPNYFVAIQINNPQIHEAMGLVQTTVLEGNKDLKSAFVPLPTLHLTLLVMYLETSEDIIRAKLALNESYRALYEILHHQPLTVELAGIGTFRNEVVFGKVKEGEQLDQLHNIADTVCACFEKHHLKPDDDKGFKPHVTLMKLSRAPKLKRKGIKKIEPALYQEYKDSAFGTELIQGLQLCSMYKPKDEFGYYHVAHQRNFADEAVDEEDFSPIKVISQTLVQQAIEAAVEQLKQEKILKQIKTEKPAPTSPCKSAQEEKEEEEKEGDSQQEGTGVIVKEEAGQVAKTESGAEKISTLATDTQAPSSEQETDTPPSLLEQGSTTQPSLKQESTTQPSLEQENTTQPSLEQESTTQPSLEQKKTTQPSLERKGKGTGPCTVTGATGEDSKVFVKEEILLKQEKVDIEPNKERIESAKKAESPISPAEEDIQVKEEKTGSDLVKSSAIEKSFESSASSNKGDSLASEKAIKKEVNKEVSCTPSESEVSKVKSTDKEISPQPVVSVQETQRADSRVASIGEVKSADLEASSQDSASVAQAKSADCGALPNQSVSAQEIKSADSEVSSQLEGTAQEVKNVKEVDTTPGKLEAAQESQKARSHIKTENGINNNNLKKTPFVSASNIPEIIVTTPDNKENIKEGETMEGAKIDNRIPTPPPQVVKIQKILKWNFVKPESDVKAQVIVAEKPKQ